MCLVLYLEEGDPLVSLELAILGLLGERPRSGYELKTRCFNGPLRPLWAADQAQIYRTLDRLAQSGHVSSTRERQTGRPDRRLYEITSAGREVLGSRLAEHLPVVNPRDPFLLHLYFGGSLPDETLLEMLEERRAHHAAQIAVLESTAAGLEAENTSSRVAVLRQTAFDGAAERERALVRWLDDCIHALNEGALPDPQAAAEIGKRHAMGAKPS
jgi:DNA-binding PadR family transcriptional regulator